MTLTGYRPKIHPGAERGGPTLSKCAVSPSSAALAGASEGDRRT
jgi:hypothetical protein